ncbi:MAG: arabinose transporter [Proteobacteria bacterium]|nr:arabinose transporter [Pseudomonadota bacterium]
MPDRTSRVSFNAVLPLMAAVFVAFLVIGLAMPVLPLHVHDGLGLGTFVVGLVAGSQFASALLTRPWAGGFSDRRGAKRAAATGLVIAAIAGLLYLLSLAPASPTLAGTILVFGRLLLGAAESVIITGAVTWGMILAGPASTGRVIAWVGAAMFAAFAAGAPIGAALYAAYGFAAIGIATAVAPLGTLLLIAPMRAVPPTEQERPPFLRVLGAVWQPGTGSALSSVGFGAITAFVTLLFALRGWSHAWLPYTAFAGVFIVARLLLGHLPDRMGGAKVALVCLLIEALGLASIWLADTASLALLGAALTGLGYSLVYPGLGVEAVSRVPAESRGLAMGAYTAFLDLALGASGPLLGLVAGAAGLEAAFLCSAVAALAAVPIAFRFLKPRPLLAKEAAHEDARRARCDCDDRFVTIDRGTEAHARA